MQNSDRKQYEYQLTYQEAYANRVFQKLTSSVCKKENEKIPEKQIGGMTAIVSPSCKITKRQIEPAN